jgi:hypothetical protein
LSKEQRNGDTAKGIETGPASCFIVAKLCFGSWVKQHKIGRDLAGRLKNIDHRGSLVVHALD